MMARRGMARRSAARRRTLAISISRASTKPKPSQRRNQPYTVRHRRRRSPGGKNGEAVPGGISDGKARHGPPTRRGQAIARTTATKGVAVRLRGASARASPRAISSSACTATISFRRAA